MPKCKIQDFGVKKSISRFYFYFGEQQMLSFVQISQGFKNYPFFMYEKKYTKLGPLQSLVEQNVISITPETVKLPELSRFPRSTDELCEAVTSSILVRF